MDGHTTQQDAKSSIPNGTNKVKTQEFYPKEKSKNFLFFIQFFFANFEFIFAIRDPKLARRGVESTLARDNTK